MFFAIPLLFIPLLMIPLLGVICLLVVTTGVHPDARRRSGLAVVAATVVVLVVLLVMVFSGRARTQQEQAALALERRQAQVAVRQEQAVLADNASWPTTALLEKQQAMRANRYPSKQAALTSLAAALGSEPVQALLQGQREFVFLEEGGLTDAMVAEFAASLQAAGVPRDQIRLGPISTGSEAVVLQYGEGGSAAHQTVSLTLEVDGLPHVLEASYVSAAWVETPDVYRSLSPNRKVYVGYSPLVDSAAVAQQQSLEHVAAVMTQSLTEGALAQVDDGRILVTLDTGNTQETRVFNIDQVFLQSFDRPYGKVWRQAVLIEGEPDSFRVRDIDHAAHALAAADPSVSPSDHSVHPWAGKAANVVGMVAVVVALYFVLNLLTKGYFRGTILVVLGVMLLIGMLLLAVHTLGSKPYEGSPSSSPQPASLSTP